MVPRLRELAPVAGGSQEVGFTQPRAHLLADPCTMGKIPAAKSIDGVRRSSFLPSIVESRNVEHGGGGEEAPAQSLQPSGGLHRRGEFP